MVGGKIVDDSPVFLDDMMMLFHFDWLKFSLNPGN
jgi:hypothetical protein